MRKLYARLEGLIPAVSAQKHQGRQRMLTGRRVGRIGCRGRVVWF